MVLISKNFLIENLSVRFAIPVISVIFKNSAAVTNTRSVQERLFGIEREYVNEVLKKS